MLLYSSIINTFNYAFKKFYMLKNYVESFIRKLINFMKIQPNKLDCMGIEKKILL